MVFGRAAATGLCLAAGLLALGAVEPAPPPSDAAPHTEASPAEPPAGDLLIASAQIQDPRFFHAVILLLRHNQDGAFGIILNRPLGSRTIADLLEAAGVADKTVEGSIPVLAGGPVQPELGFVVHSADYRRADTMAVDGNLAMTANKQALRDIGHHQGPKTCLFALGYAGWGAGQLEAEIDRKDWFVTPEDPALVFDEDRAKLWDRALARRQQDL